MQILFQNIGRRFNQKWIFRGLNFTINKGCIYAILGSNGSGKSTLIQIIAGNLSASEGEIFYTLNGKNLNDEEVYKHISFAAPYMELFEEMTLKEMVGFHFKFKKLINGLNEDEAIKQMNMEKEQNKLIGNFSSGMKQRVKVGLALFSDTPLLLLDEPCTNLDEDGIKWYKSLMEKCATNRTVFICSNNEKEWVDFEGKIQMGDYYSVGNC